MPVGLMNGSKRARNTPSIANQTSIFGIMGGLAPRTGTSNVCCIQTFTNERESWFTRIIR